MSNPACHRAGSDPDLVITDTKTPDMVGTNAAVQICLNRSDPVKLVSACHNPKLIGSAKLRMKTAVRPR